MRPAHHTLHLGDIAIEVVRKDVKNVRISVHPPDGRVRVSAPRHIRDAELMRILAIRREWIVRKQAEMARRGVARCPEYVTGEVHLLWGRQYRLVVAEGGARAHVRLIGDVIELHVPSGGTADARAAALERWYRRQLGECLEPLVAEWAQRMGLGMPEVRIRRMKTRWGSCNVRAKRIWLNLELVRRPAECLEYVVVHELAHLIEPGHGPRFHAVMDEFLPAWRERRAALRPSSSS